jgi:hypothetical protein
LISFINSYGQEGSAPEFKFDVSRFDFGEIIQGDVVEHNFEFTNIGDTPLVISKIITTCGCTAPTWPKEPILPGKKGKIKIVFNSTGKIGRQNKVATILSNTANQKDRILIMANIIPKTGS